MKFSSTLGASYASMTWLLIGIDWLYGSIALLFSMLGGMLPDLDSDSGKEIKHITSMTSVASALLFWAASGRVDPPIAFEFRVWITLFSAFFWSRGLRWFLGKITVHRGMFHSIPTCFIWGSVMYLHYPHENHWVRVYMASGIMVGYMSHLLCDEYFSVESFAGFRVNKAFGTALKFWSGSLFSTLVCYIILGFCVKQVSETWPKSSDGKYVAIGHPSESVNHLSSVAKGRMQNMVKTVRTKGLLAWLEELLTSAKTKAAEKVETVKENGLTKDGLKKTYAELKEETKNAAKANATVEAIKQIAVEAKTTVNDQVKVDAAVNAERPLQAGAGKNIGGFSESAAREMPKSVASALSVKSSPIPASPSSATRASATSEGNTAKSFQMETYQPRKRSSQGTGSETGRLATRPETTDLTKPRSTVIKR
ncbi:MAG: metal-dependent hydrolase [Isosphaeraceae bacterium]